MKFVQIPYRDALEAKILIPHTIGNIFRHMSYFEQGGGIEFEVIPDDCGLGDMIVAILRFSSGDIAAIGTRPTTRNRGVELLCVGPETESAVLASFRQAFPDLTDAEIDTRKI